MFNLNNKYTVVFFLALFIRSNFYVSNSEIKIFNPEGQECIQDKNGKSYRIWRLGSNTSEEGKKAFLKKFSYNNRTEEEKKIINNEIDIIDNLIFGSGILSIEEYLLKFLDNNYKSKYSSDESSSDESENNSDLNIIIIENEINNINFIAGGIIYKNLRSNYKKNRILNDMKMKKMKKIEMKKKYNFIEIDILTICENLQKNGLGSVLLNKLNIRGNINFLKSVIEAENFYKKYGYKQIDNTCFYYKINENKFNDRIPIINKPLLALEFSSIEDRDNKIK